jgi:glucose/arabinose dehydrogenase
MHKLSFVTGLAACALLVAAPDTSAQTLSTERIASGLSLPVWAGSPPNDERIFVIEQRGVVRIIDAGGTLLPTPFLDIDSLIPSVSNGDERGLLGLAFHPDFEFNGKFYVCYYNLSNQTVVAQYELTSANDANEASALRLLTYAQPFSNHNGGCLQFGPDGYLYVSTGDGGNANDPACRAQNKLNPLGKMLRYDIDTLTPTGPGTATPAIPATNPFVGNPAYLPEIYHLGLRNPWRFSFDRTTGNMYIGDVGQNAAEEANATLANVAGLNFGWRVLEGNLNNGQGSCPGGTPPFGSPLYTAPIWSYAQSGNGFCVTGGYVYRGCAIPSLNGQYIVGDFGSNKIWKVRWNGTGVVAFNDATQNITADLAPGGGLNLQTPSSFGEDGRGELLICDYFGGEVFRMIPQSPTLPAQCDALRGRFTRLSVANGGTTYLDMDAGAANAGNIFFVAGSVTGTTPGTTLVGGLTLPLNVDAYTLYIVSNPGAPPLTGNFGALDADGRAFARFSIAPGQLNASYVGTVLNHAYVVLDPLGSVVLASNAVATTLGS